MRTISKTLLTPALVLFGMPLCCLGADNGYFPDRVFYQEKDRNDFDVEWYSKQLKAMNAPSLWKLSRRDRSATVYRFLWLPSFDHPVSVRITERL